MSSQIQLEWTVLWASEFITRWVEQVFDQFVRRITSEIQARAPFLTGRLQRSFGYDRAQFSSVQLRLPYHTQGGRTSFRTTTIRASATIRPVDYAAFQERRRAYIAPAIRDVIQRYY